MIIPVPMIISNSGGYNGEWTIFHQIATVITCIGVTIVLVSLVGMLADILIGNEKVLEFCFAGILIGLLVTVIGIAIFCVILLIEALLGR